MTLHARSNDAHTTVLQTLLVHLLTTADLSDLCEDAGIADLVDADGQPVDVTSVLTYDDAGVLSLDRGVVIELSDGARVACPLSLQAPPGPGTSLRTATVHGVDLTGRSSTGGAGNSGGPVGSAD